MKNTFTSINKLILIILMLPIVAIGQHNDYFGKFTDQNNAPIRGTSMERGYERQLVISNLVSSATNNNTTVEFDMPTCPATGNFMSIVNVKQVLRTGEIVTLTQEKDTKKVISKIVMEDIRVEECIDANNTTHVTLRAKRIGWISYSIDRMGRTTIISKTGWDDATQSSWTNF